ncbi:MAG: bifunctional proline dehydrogenase/L-glutamate gamma-semialdehyde dehydrogenase PutA [Pseudomonadota bacterium]
MQSTLTELSAARASVRAATLADEEPLLAGLSVVSGLDAPTRKSIHHHAAALVRVVRSAASPGLMETFLAEYGLSTDEGIALMCLAEALLRVPDAATIDALIEDKIAPSDWGKHLGHSSSSLVNASTWALLMTGRVLDEPGRGVAGIIRGAVKRLGEPVIRAAVAEAMRRLGRQFVLGETITSALSRAAAMEARGYLYSYDMLGEAARTFADAERYRLSYEGAIAAIAARSSGQDVRANPGISIKLSALHPRYELLKRRDCVDALVSIVLPLAEQAAQAGMGLNIDAEEQDRLDLSLDVIEQVAASSRLGDWPGFGVVVQAYGRRALPVIGWLDKLSKATGRPLMVRLVKGAYWDTEIKRAQVVGTESFPVFTRKAGTDVSYLACARALLERAPQLYPQFATHNAATVAAVLAMGRGRDYEFQRLHGMGEALYEVVRRDHDVPVRIYAPVGAHEDLLAYLVRRLLENGANSSFANQIVNDEIAPEAVAADPMATLEASSTVNPRLRQPPALYGAERRNSRGHDLYDPVGLATFETLREPFSTKAFAAAPLTVQAHATSEPVPVHNPANPDDRVGEVTALDPSAAGLVVEDARAGINWAPPDARAAVLRKAADLYEANAGAFFALAAREAGKTVLDAVAELREAVDFLRYYAGEAERLAAGGHLATGGHREALGVVLAISPWNFPLAIFTGQIAAAIAAGNAVVAKPAEQTPLIAAAATALLHEAGVPPAALQLCPGDGAVGVALSAARGLGAVCFTGSTATAKHIDRQLSQTSPDAVLVAETGGLNGMVVDSTALPEQAVRDIVASAFQSAGQRCSALRILYVQRDVEERILKMLVGAMETLSLGDPWPVSCDVGPVIDAGAKARIMAHIEVARREGRVVAPQHPASPEGSGLFVPPTVIRVDGIEALEEEIFGPVLHVATFEASALEAVVEAVNRKGYGLTFGIHSRIDDRVETVVSAVEAGNIYVNRNQIGAVVGSQPFGGEKLSGTGPKAGGPYTVARLCRPAGATAMASFPPPVGAPVPHAQLQAAVDAVRAQSGPLSVRDMPGPTGESNRLSTHPRGVILCAGPTADAAMAQAAAARASNNGAVVVAPGVKDEGCVDGGVSADAHLRHIDGSLDPQSLATLTGIDAVAYDCEASALRPALAGRDGPIVPVLQASDLMVIERHLCIDTAAAGGNAELLSSTEDTVPDA